MTTTAVLRAAWASGSQDGVCVHAASRLVSLVGVRDLVVETPDAVLMPARLIGHQHGVELFDDTYGRK